MYAYLLNPPADRPMIREGRCQSPSNMRKTSVPQLSLAYIATSLRRAGAEVALTDAIAFDWTTEDLLRELDSRVPDLLVCNTTTPTIVNDVGVFKAVKAKYPAIPIVIFGAHSTVLHRQMLEQHECIDAVVRGEPELSIRELYERLDRGESWADCPGATARVDGEISEGPDRKFERKLDELGWPARDLMPHDHYIHPLSGKRYTTVNVGRGCPQECTFCVAPIYYGRPLRFRSPDDVVKELREDVVGRHGIDHCWFYADDLTAHEQYLTELCHKMIEAKLNIKWWGNTRADVQSQELFNLMSKAGCFMLSIGGESGVDEILKRAKKRIVAEDIKVTVRMLRKAGITSLTYFLVGLPGETKETIEQTIAFAKEAGPDYVEFYPATPYPGTELEKQAEEDKLIVDRDWDKYECGGTHFVVQVHGMEQRDLEKKLRSAYREYYLRPGYIGPRIMREIKNPRRMAKLAKFGVQYFARLGSK